LERLRGNRTLVFGLAILLVAVPTAAALFPGYVYRTDRDRRVAVMVAWLAVAALATFVSQSRESSAHAMAKSSHRMLLRRHVEDLLGEGCGIPPEYQATVYLPDDKIHLLHPFKAALTEICFHTEGLHGPAKVWKIIKNGPCERVLD